MFNLISGHRMRPGNNMSSSWYCLERWVDRMGKTNGRACIHASNDISALHSRRACTCPRNTSKPACFRPNVRCPVHQLTTC